MPALLLLLEEVLAVLLVLMLVLAVAAFSEEGAGRFFPADDRGEPVFFGEPGAVDDEVTSGAAGAAIVGDAGAAAVGTTDCGGCWVPVAVVMEGWIDL